MSLYLLPVLSLLFFQAYYLYFTTNPLYIKEFDLLNKNY